MAKQIAKIAGQMIIYILIIVALVFFFYPESPRQKLNASAQGTDANQVSLTKN